MDQLSQTALICVAICAVAIDLSIASTLASIHQADRLLSAQMDVALAFSHQRVIPVCEAVKIAIISTSQLCLKWMWQWGPISVS